MLAQKPSEDSLMTPLYSTDVNIKSFFSSTKKLNWVPPPAYLYQLKNFWEYSFQTKNESHLHHSGKICFTAANLQLFYRVHKKSALQLLLQDVRQREPEDLQEKHTDKPQAPFSPMCSAQAKPKPA